jgi:RNA polymerase sigma-70 factor (ECF subfamily)
MAHARFANAYDTYYDSVRRTLQCLGVPEAAIDDAVQEVFVVVHRRMQQTPSAAVPREWIYGVARRIAWRHHRTSTRSQRRESLADPPNEFGSPERELELDEAVAFMTRFLDSLDDDQRVVFVLSDIEGLTARELGVIVEASPNTVASRLRLARAKFAAALANRSAASEVRRGR